MNWFTRWLRPLRRNTPEDAEHFPTVFRVEVGGAAPEAAQGALPRFSGPANQSLRSAGTDPVRQLLARAYPLAQPISDRRQFAGRRDLLGTVIRAIEERRLHVVLFGDRGIGKTSLLHIIAQLAKDARYVVRYASCSRTSQFDPTFRAILRNIPQLYHDRVEPTSSQVESGQTLDDLVGSRALTPVLLGEILDGISGTRLLIILDEFDRTALPEFRQEVAELIKNLSDRGSPTQLLIGGVAETLGDLIRHIPSIRRNVLGIPVTGMPREEIIEIVHNGERITSVTFTDEALDLVVRAANGSPYVTNLVAHQACGLVLERNGAGVLLDDVARAAAEVATELAQRLDAPARRQLDQLDALTDRDCLAKAMAHALDHFGHVPIDQFACLRALPCDGPENTETSDPDGSFRFIDDSIPLILWLRLVIAELGENRSSPPSTRRADQEVQ